MVNVFLFNLHALSCKSRRKALSVIHSRLACALVSALLNCLVVVNDDDDDVVVVVVVVVVAFALTSPDLLSDRRPPTQHP